MNFDIQRPPTRRKWLGHSAALLGAYGIGLRAWAQPSAGVPMRILVGASPGGSTDTLLRKIMSVAGVFDIEVVVARLLLVLARGSTAAGVPSSTKTPYRRVASQG